MDLSKILAITGKPGLYLVISQTKTGALVESIIDKKKIPVFSTEKMSSLNDISVFTDDEDLPLHKVLKAIYDKENGGKCIDPKSDNNALKKYMEEVLPNYDKDRVYVSDMKKLFSWYNMLHEQNLLDFSEEKATEESAEVTEVKE
ncbi:MAG: DUF5606 domain-containing protein [Bacteroidetes bacterium]|nr:DUF5606 domain-containing protein [Bacteroidota bacterium]